MTNQVGKQKGVQQDVVDTSRIREFLRINPPSFTSTSIIGDPEIFAEEIQKVLVIMHVTDADAERVELVAYQPKGVTRICNDPFGYFK